MPTALKFDTTSVVALDDADGAFVDPREVAFPDATAEHWRRADGFDPGAVRNGQWWLRFRCFAFRHPGGEVVLVDAGIGPAGAPARAWAPVPGRLPAELAAAGIDPSDVTTVILTHLHTDHVGWSIGADGAPYFANARYLLQRVEVETLARQGPLATWLVEPLRASGQLSELDGETSLGELRIVPTPGHTPGHQSVLLETRDGTLLATGDLLVHAVQLLDPEIAYAHEMDPAAARTTRVALLHELSRRANVTLATAHMGAPFVALPATDAAMDRP